MKKFITIFLLLSTVTAAFAGKDKSTVTCTFPKKVKVLVEADKADPSVGKAYFYKKKELYRVYDVNLSSNGDTFATAEGQGFTLTIDAEAGYRGWLTIQQHDKNLVLKGKEMSCSDVPTDWSIPLEQLISF